MFSMRRWPFLFVAFALALSGCSSLLYYPSRNLFFDPAKLPNHPRDVGFMSEDGTHLTGWYFRASEKSLEGKPPKGVLLFFHGNAENVSSHFTALYWILEKGYDFFIFDYRGYGRSGGEPSPKGTVEDGRAALRWLAANKPEGVPIIIFGQSLGGAVALRVAGDLKDEVDFKKIAVDSTFHSYRSVARKALSKHWLTWLFQPLAFVVMSDRYGPADAIPTLAPRPFLVIHGTNDRSVDFSLGEKVFELAAEPKTFWRIEGGGHIDALSRDLQGSRAKFLEWLAR